MDAVLSCLVIIHLVTEYVHHALEFYHGIKDSKILPDILKHRKGSKKTALLESAILELQSLRIALEKHGVDVEEDPS